jgi:succinoglycan biosynthesis transport protein ExoP
MTAIKKNPPPSSAPSPQVPAPPHPYSEHQYYGHYYGPYSSSGSNSWLDELTPARLFSIVRRKWLTILLALTFILTLAAVYLTKATRIYRATSLIEMTVRRPRISGQEEAVIEDPALSRIQAQERIFNTRLEKFKGRSMRNRALEHVQRFLDQSIKTSDDELAKILAENVEFELIRDSQLVRIKFDSPDQRLAVAAANAYAQSAVELAIEENRNLSENAVRWLEDQAAERYSQLEAAEADLVDFRAANEMDLLTSRKETVKESLMAYNQELVRIESQLILTRDLLNQLESVDENPENIANLPADTPRMEDITVVFEAWQRATQDKAELLIRYTEKHPAVIAQTEIIDTLQNEVALAVKRARNTTQANLRLLESQAESVRKQKDQESDRFSKIEQSLIEKNAELTALQRKRDASDMAYRSLLERIEVARMAADEETASIKVSEPAQLPAKLVSPKTVRILALAILLGCALGGGLALLQDLLEDHVTSAFEIERGLGLNILGIIPYTSKGDRHELARLCLKRRSSHIVEAFAGIRSLVNMLPGDEVPRSILVTSTMPEEGKTVTASNLAAMFARSGVRTLLVDFDLRRPRLRKIFSVSNEHDSLMHTLDRKDPNLFAKLVHSTENDNLNIIVSTADVDQSPAEVIANAFLEKFFEWAHENYDKIIVDSPPLGIVSDAVVLSGHCDATVLVCRPNKSRKGATRKALQRFNEVDTRILGVVVNEADMARRMIGNYHYNSYSAEAYNRYHQVNH